MNAKDEEQERNKKWQTHGRAKKKAAKRTKHSRPGEEGAD